jgi:class 3 adenylate cyclase
MYPLAANTKSNSWSNPDFSGVIEPDAPASRTEKLKRSLLTLLFTDIVGSTQMIEHLGDEAWYMLHMQHDAVVRTRLAAFGGREVKCAGDGFFAVFDAPARGIHCAAAIRSALEGLSIRIRCGMHASECLIAGSLVTGLAVHITARIASAARPNEILVSRAAKELAAGVDIEFADGQLYALRGLSDEQELFTAIV